jgi:L-histidine N-alpha-methyltransferase
MRLAASADQTVTISDLAMKVTFAHGEEIRTEISAKFRRARVAEELQAAGLAMTHWWTDDNGDFGLSLSRRVA